MRLPTISKLFVSLALAFSALSLAGCITINIYFPASAAEKAADKIIDEIWQAPGGVSGTAPSSPASSPATNDKTVKP